MGEARPSQAEKIAFSLISESPRIWSLQHPYLGSNKANLWYFIRKKADPHPHTYILK